MSDEKMELVHTPAAAMSLFLENADLFYNLAREAQGRSYSNALKVLRSRIAKNPEEAATRYEWLGRLLLLNACPSIERDGLLLLP